MDQMSVPGQQRIIESRSERQRKPYSGGHTSPGGIFHIQKKPLRTEQSTSGTPGLRGQKLDFTDLQKGKAWWIPHAVGWASAMPHARSKWSRNSLDLRRTEAHLQITLIPDCINMIQIANSTSHLPETNINPPWSTISLL